MEGDPKFNASQELPDFPYARYAELIGLRGVCIDQPEELGNAWDRAFDTGRTGCHFILPLSRLKPIYRRY